MDVRRVHFRGRRGWCSDYNIYRKGAMARQWRIGERRNISQMAYLYVSLSRVTSVWFDDLEASGSGAVGGVDTPDATAGGAFGKTTGSLGGSSARCIAAA